MGRNNRDRSNYDTNNGYHAERLRHDDSHSSGRRERSHSRERNEDHQHKTGNEDLMEKVRRQEREKSTAKGKAYASRPRTFKDSLGLKQDGRVLKKRSASPEYSHIRAVGKWSSRDDNAKIREARESMPLPAQKSREELGAI